MATGDAAAAAGMDLVSGSTPANQINLEINKTRDYLAARTPKPAPLDEGGTGATTKAAARTNLGITSGTANPSGGDDGDIYFKIV